MPRTSKSKKTSMKTAKRMVTKLHKAKAKKNMDTFFLRAKVTAAVIPKQGVTVANYLYNTTQLLSGNLQTSSEFNFYRLQYDKFRVNAVRVIYTPKANVLSQADANNDADFNVVGDGMIHTCIDRDGIAPSSVSAISRYPSYKAFSIMKKWRRQYSIRYPRGVWLDCQDPTASQSQSIVNTLGLGGSVTWYAENFLEDNYEVWNEPVAQVELQFDVVFQGKTSAGLEWSVDEGGKVQGVTITPYESIASLPLTPLRNIRGTIADTLITDEVTDVPVTDTAPPS